MTALLTLPSLLLLGALAQHGSGWTYSGGPLDEAHWAEEYPTCSRERQSPINLQRKKVQYNPTLQALKLTGYGAQGGEFSMINNGHTVQISLPPTMHMTANGTKYVALQMHFHWGGASSEISGSEHTIDGTRYVAEMHVVHYNSKYGSYDKAKNATDGLAVLAALIEIKDYSENIYYSDFISHLKNVRYTGQTTVLNGLDVQDMLPPNLHNYYSYKGSLTTPPCTENVQWFLLADFIQLSKAQVWKLENSLLDNQNRTLHNIYRRTQPLNNRVVEANFMYHPNYHYNLGSDLQFHLRKIKGNIDSLRKLTERKGTRKEGFQLVE